MVNRRFHGYYTKTYPNSYITLSHLISNSIASILKHQPASRSHPRRHHPPKTPKFSSPKTVRLAFWNPTVRLPGKRPIYAFDAARFFLWHFGVFFCWRCAFSFFPFFPRFKCVFFFVFFFGFFWVFFWWLWWWWFVFFLCNFFRNF